MFYNEAVRSVVGEMHPEPLGNPLAKIWGAPMGCHLNEMLTSSIKRGKQLHNKGAELVLFCDEFLQSCSLDFGLLLDLPPDGRLIAVFSEVTETVTYPTEKCQRVCRLLIEGVTRVTGVPRVRVYIPTCTRGLQRRVLCHSLCSQFTRCAGL
jgi:hypothetical protein